MLHAAAILCVFEQLGMKNEIDVISHQLVL